MSDPDLYERLREDRTHANEDYLRQHPDKESDEDVEEVEAETQAPAGPGD